MTRAPKTGIVASIGHAPASRGETAEDINREVKKTVEAMPDDERDSEEARDRVRRAFKRGRKVGKLKQQARAKSRITANENRSRAAAAIHAGWQGLANATWREHPTWSRWRVADLVADRFDAKRDTIYRAIVRNA